MSLGSPDVPATPSFPSNMVNDPFSVAAAQQGYNTTTGIMNQAGSMAPLSTPGWSQNYQQVGVGPGGVPIYGISQSLSPEQQQNYSNYLANQQVASSQVPQLLSGGQNMLMNGAAFNNLASSEIGNAGANLQAASNYSAQAPGWYGAAGNRYGTAENILNSMFPALGQAGATFGGAQNVFNTSGSRLGQGQGYFDQAGNWVNAYAGQNPSMIGDMASGLTGQRMQAAVAGIAPFQQDQRDQLDTKLKNQGLHPGMPGYDNAMSELDYSQNQAISSFMAQFQPQAWQQATQIFQNPLTSAQAYQGLGGAQGTLGTQTAGLGANVGQLGQGYLGLGQGYLGGAQGMQGIGGAYAGIGNNYNQLASTNAGIGAQYGALANTYANMGATQGNQGLAMMSQALPWLAASAPSMPPAPTGVPLNIQPTNLAGLSSNYNNTLTSNYQNQLSAYNAAQQNQQNMLSGLFGLGSTALGGLAAGGFLSDRALKEHIVPVGILKNGINLYEFNYKGGGPTIIGPMADEVEKLMPEAVSIMDGHKIVDYRMVMA